MHKKKNNFYINVVQILKDHITNNLKEYFIVSVIFLIGVVLGVFIINNINEEQKGQISIYINDFINSLKEDYKIDSNIVLNKVLINNIFLIVILWVLSMITVVGVLLVGGIILFRGVLLGFTISSGMLSLGFWNGLFFNFCSLFSQNIIYIPCLIAIGVSTIKFYKVITNKKNRDNVKLEFIRHSIFCSIIGIVFILSSFIEAYISSNILNTFANCI